MRLRPLPLLLAGLLAGCAEGPFIDLPVAQSVEKPADPVAKTGEVAVCHTDATPLADIEALAREACAKHGYQVSRMSTRRWQCRATAPHQTLFACTLPGMVTEDGRPINPTDKAAVEAWRKRTGKNVPLPQSGRPAPQRPAAAPAAPLPAPAAIGPADIAGKPVPPMPAVPGAGSAVPPPLAPSGFTVEPGSWGQHFED